MHTKKFIVLAVALWVSGITPAHSSGGICRNFVTSWLGYAEPSPGSRERSLEDLLEHVDRGTLETSGAGTLKIKSGVHTYDALLRVLHSHGLTAEDFTNNSLSLNALEGKSPRIEELHNGILRVQLGEDLWANESSRDSARVTVAPEQTYFGIKTIFPKGMSVKALRRLMKEFYEMVSITALPSELTSPHYSVEDCFDSTDPEIPPMRLKMVLAYGRPVSFFPTWIQRSCY